MQRWSWGRPVTVPELQVSPAASVTQELPVPGQPVLHWDRLEFGLASGPESVSCRD